MKEDPIILGCSASTFNNGAVLHRKGEVFLVSKSTASKLLGSSPAYCNLTPSEVCKALPDGPFLPTAVTTVSQGPCHECADPDTLYLGQRLTDCSRCGGTKVVLKLL